jgi:hypothetical protein
MRFAFNFAARAAALFALLALPARAAEKPPHTVSDLIATVRAGFTAHKDDKQIAKSIAKFKLSERLDPVVLDHLESEGAGPRTLEELARLEDETLELPPPTPPPAFPHPLLPSQAEMSAAIYKARLFAASYDNNLPDFLCDENIVRYEQLGANSEWRQRDTLRLRISYEDQQEREKLVAWNGRLTQLTLAAVGGAQTTGEFGSLMLQVLDPRSKGKFRWDHWTLLRNRPTEVYSYHIDAADSQYRLLFGAAYDRAETVPAMEGMLYLDAETGEVMRIANHAADIEPGFPVRLAATTLDYGAQEIGGKRFVLPLHSETRMATTSIHTRNFMQFSGYRKFTGDSTITFGDPDTAAEPKIKHW